MPTAIIKLIGLGCIGLTSGVALVSVAVGANFVADALASVSRSRRRAVGEGATLTGPPLASTPVVAAPPAAPPLPDGATGRYAKMRGLTTLDAVNH